jgi:antitoxin VapB
MTSERRAKLFRNGGSQAVRLPADFRMSGDEVRIRREGRSVILEPIEKEDWPAGFWERFAELPPLPEDFALPEPLPPTPHRDVSLDAPDAE